jgi:hypothetical protein
VGELPPQLVASVQPHVSQQELFICAATEGRRDHLYQAAMFDPLTSAKLTLDQIVRMCDELIAAHGSVPDGGLLPPQLVAYVQPHVSQQELFICAATEGRRDHLYQAAMFDPLTSAKLTLDQIVRMCDELIAAHGSVPDGGLLPPLAARPAHVPVPASPIYGRIDAKTLRASWDAAQAKAAEEFIESWHVIGPFKSPRDGEISLDLPTRVEDDFLRRGDGTVNLKMNYPTDTGGAMLAWEKVFASPKTGVVNLTAELGPYEWAVAYAYAEFESPAERDTILRCGSDDGIRIWLNGKRVQNNDARRPYNPHSDAVPVRLTKGTNRILVKIDNAKFAWSFGVAVPAEG